MKNENSKHFLNFRFSDCFKCSSKSNKNPKNDLKSYFKSFSFFLKVDQINKEDTTTNLLNHHERMRKLFCNNNTKSTITTTTTAPPPNCHPYGTLSITGSECKCKVNIQL